MKTFSMMNCNLRFILIFLALNLLVLNQYLLSKNLLEFMRTYESSFIIEQQQEKQLDSYYSNAKLGSFIENGKTYFRLFAPSAANIKLCTFTNPEDTAGNEYGMTKDEDGTWLCVLEGELRGLFYGYKIFTNDEDPSIVPKEICIDPYAKAVATYTTYMNPRRSIVYEDKYNWENDSWIQRDWRDLIIYEMHIRDLTAHSSSGSSIPGTYKGLVEKSKTSGIDYIKSLGVNTVELLPAQEYGYVEIPFRDSLGGKFNTWNPYERNHWGYMTGAFFAPAAYYSEIGENLPINKWIGKEAKQVKDFKDMVKAFHNEGIGVIMDVVYNHLSEYEIGNLKQIDKEYYFRLDEYGNYITESWCGNDLKTERPMMRRLIIDSIIHWMTEYHVDGFRFDLGKLLDWKTIEEIIVAAKKINPDVVIVCEPWGGGYDPTGFSQRGWGAWNDQIRNGIKGENPFNGLGWIFGQWYGNNNVDRIKSYVNGTLTRDSLGLFIKKEHSVNYLESHDGYTLGDFIRIGSKEVDPRKVVADLDKNAALSPFQLQLNKLAALFLFTSQGITMIHEGQEFARSKVIATGDNVDDEEKGKIDHNSYNKDNETNYLNYSHAVINEELSDYYKGLIKLRSEYPAFRRAVYDDITFHTFDWNEFALAYELKYDDTEFYVAFNANHDIEQEIKLPDGIWEIFVDKNTVGTDPLKEISCNIVLEPISGVVLKRKN